MAPVHLAMIDYPYYENGETLWSEVARRPVHQKEFLPPSISVPF